METQANLLNVLSEIESFLDLRILPIDISSIKNLRTSLQDFNKSRDVPLFVDEEIDLTLDLLSDAQTTEDCELLIQRFEVMRMRIEIGFNATYDISPTHLQAIS